MVVIVHRSPHAAAASEWRRGHGLVQQNFKGAGEVLEGRRQRPQLGKSHRVISCMKLLDPLPKVARVSDRLKGWRRPERIRGVESQFGREMKRLEQHGLRIGPEQSES